MKRVRKFVLYGCGGFALEIIEYLKDHALQLSSLGESLKVTDLIDETGGRLEDTFTALGCEPNVHREISSVEDLSDKKVLICLGDPIARYQLYHKLKEAGCRFGTLIHHTAWIASTAQIGEGTIVCPFVFVGPKAIVGPSCVVNVRATIAHDVFLEHSTVISPHADLNGKSGCGKAAFVGAGAIFDPGNTIGQYSKVASGAVVKQDFGDGFLLMGNPAKGRQMFKAPV